MDIKNILDQLDQDLKTLKIKSLDDIEIIKPSEEDERRFANHDPGQQ